jgi:hypothetical protein
MQQQLEKSKLFQERRKHQRFSIKDIAFAIIRSEGEEELGQIVNISLGGLAFQYFIGNREFQKAEKLDVLLADSGVQVENIQFRVVDDYELVNELPFSSITKREQRVYFDGLDKSQQDELEGFIRRHTYSKQNDSANSMF